MLKNILNHDYPAGQQARPRNLVLTIWPSVKHALIGKLHSTKELLFCAIITATLLSPQLLRADIIYNVSRGGGIEGLFDTSIYAGNTFLTTSSPSILNSISLYLAISPADISPTGTLNLDIYEATASSIPGLYVPNTTTTRLARASINVEGLTNGSAAFTPFTYSGINAITLSANTNYAFYLDATSVIFNDGAIHYLTNDTSLPANGNFFQSDWAPNGDALVAISGEIDVTAVPEPGTLILTGSALLAGAIGVYFTRRHRDQALTPAAV